jgi:hypothetical protein
MVAGGGWRDDRIGQIGTTARSAANERKPDVTP